MKKLTPAQLDWIKLSYVHCDGNIFKKGKNITTSNISIKNKQLNLYYYVSIHKLIWFLEKGYFSEKIINHINNDNNDNRIENLIEDVFSKKIANKNTNGISNTFAHNFPDISKEWSFILNKEITPDKNSMSSNNSIWWLCTKCNANCRYDIRS